MIEGYDKKLLQSFEYETTAISNKKIIGTCELGQATIQLINDSNNYSDLKKTWIKTKFGSFYIYDVEPVQEKINIKLSCYDVKYKLDTEYNSSLYKWPQTLKNWRNAIFDNCGVEYDDSDFPNSDLILDREPNLNNSKTNRQVLCIIAQAGCSWIEVDENDKFYFKWFTENEYEAKDWSSLTTEKTASLPINLVVLSRGDVGDDVYYPKNKPSQKSEFKIENNYILDPQDIFSTEDIRGTTIIPIYNRVNGFSYIVYEITSMFIKNKLSIKLGDKITYTDIYGNKLTSYVMTRKISFIGGDVEDDNNYQITLSAEEIEESNTEISTNTNVIDEITNISRKADKSAGVIEDLITQENIQNQKISQVTQTVDELNSKIGDIADITTSAESDYNILIFNNINQSEPIYIKIHPISEDITYLYPNDSLYPSDELFLKERKLLFVNTTTLEIIEYELPCDLLYYDSENYDELILNYETQSCIVNKKVGIDENCKKYLLDNSITMEFDYPKIELTDGDYTINIDGYSTAYLFIRLMSQNIYTTQFATRTEVNSLISQTSTEINLEVQKKVNEDEIISKINISPESVKISAKDKLSLEGYTTINNGFSVDLEGNMTCNNANINGDIVTSKGVLTNLIFPCEWWGWYNENVYDGQGGGFIGFNFDTELTSVQKSFLNFTVRIPNGFTVKSAKIHLKHTPVNWYNTDGSATNVGRCQNMRVYNAYNLGTTANGAYFSEFNVGGNTPSLNQIDKVNQFSFGTNYETYSTENFAETFTNSGDYNIVVATTFPKPSATIDNAYVNLGQYTGVLTGVLEIIGYTSTV